MTEVRFVFGRLQAQGMPEYPSGAHSPFVFSITNVEGRPQSWESAYALLGFYRDEFVKACLAAHTSSEMSPIEGRQVWIPTCYLDTPTIEVISSAYLEELLLNGTRPNPNLSIANQAA